MAPISQRNASISLNTQAVWPARSARCYATTPSKTVTASPATDPLGEVAEPQALDATDGHKWQQNATELPEKQAFTPELVLKNVAMARRLTGYAQMVTPKKVTP